MVTDPATGKARYWADMPPRLKVRFAGTFIFFLTALYFAAGGAVWAYVLLSLPIVWFAVRVFALNPLFNADESRADSLARYTLDHVWNAGRLVRFTTVILIFAATVGALGWVSTHDLRAERAELTLSERAVAATRSAGETISEATDASVEASKGWIARAKGWFD